jgi:hypothetical protein
MTPRPMKPLFRGRPFVMAGLVPAISLKMA